MKGPLFYAKVLLFGEYGIIRDSMGLSVPYNFYKGTLKIEAHSDKELQEKSNLSMRGFAEFLKSSAEINSLEVSFDLLSLEQDLNSGMYFDSSIPQGYGVGSSGALVAAIYDRYCINKIDHEDKISKDMIQGLKEIFSTMESYFHGKSSGIDPLICYLNLPLLIKSKTDIDTIGIPEMNVGNGAIFLIDSGQPGETEPMVNIFMDKCKNEGFRTMLKDQFIKYNDACINSFVKGEFSTLLKDLKSLSSLVFENFKPMIPDSFHSLWLNGIESDDYYMKLCGSGGGGYILGFAQDFKKAKKALKGHKLEVIYRF